MFKSLAAGFNRCSENKKNSAYRQVDSPTNSDAPTYLDNDKPEGKATTQASSEKDKPEEKATAQAMQQHESYVQVCPHERLSFERFQRIQDLMRNVRDRRLDALSAMPKKQ